MRVIGILSSRIDAGAPPKPDRPKPTMAKDGYEVISCCDDDDYRKASRRGRYSCPTRDHIFKPDHDEDD